MSLSLLRFQGLGDGGSAELTPSLATQIPLDEVSTFGQSCPIGVALVIARNGKEFPTRADFDAFEDVDPGQCCSPPPVILADNKADNKNCNFKILKVVNRKLAFYH
jgi:hypothetical protein